MESANLQVLQEYANKNKGLKNQKDGVFWVRTEVNGKSRVVEASEDYVAVYSFNEGLRIEVSDETRVYEAVNCVNEEMNTFTVEFDPVDKYLRLKSSLVLVNGIDLAKAIDFYEKFHDKYFNAILDTFINLSAIPDLQNIGRIIKERVNKT